ncbi:hypothetical protein HMI54_015445 [Coelomomyces lativittatus]|nr:hypothetical protein HMI56_000694 [Coelomomyces lativittatus]KAJ1512873.1 hypothetical protein HMI54_015445 [Coelomomyces lativittatus]KAJ1517762.1 hypothetical protein HMI55_006076 [Coelomomyces lativittatus]
MLSLNFTPYSLPDASDTTLPLSSKSTSSSSSSLVFPTTDGSEGHHPFPSLVPLPLPLPLPLPTLPSTAQFTPPTPPLSSSSTSSILTPPLPSSFCEHEPSSSSSFPSPSPHPHPDPATVVPFLHLPSPSDASVYRSTLEHIDHVLWEAGLLITEFMPSSTAPPSLRTPVPVPGPSVSGKGGVWKSSSSSLSSGGSQGSKKNRRGPPSFSLLGGSSNSGTRASKPSPRSRRQSLGKSLETPSSMEKDGGGGGEGKGTTRKEVGIKKPRKSRKRGVGQVGEVTE